MAHREKELGREGSRVSQAHSINKGIYAENFKTVVKPATVQSSFCHHARPILNNFRVKNTHPPPGLICPSCLLAFDTLSYLNINLIDRKIV